ncbi:hypothetical protein [Salinibacillus xinjiangensis]|uniref:Uncharacterized protein n=1 Tax=Salinibacillus xinjiangensis TaxID=1229268 RepID=A0A6G1X708_9BACI|nr:hypothetical protein [Salinibacillus xinjiangensis]MRG86722.1 hypothetical protein [Salinibacillus xinjiangensis]
MHQLGLTNGFYEDIAVIRGLKMKPSIQECLPWLDSNCLTRSANDLRIRNGKELIEADKLLFGLSTSRTKKKTKSEIDLIIKKYNKLSSNNLSQKKMESLWEQLRSPQFHFFDVNRVSPDALGFYRPFHFAPYDDWGIYLFADKLIDYYHIIKSKLGSNTIFFQPDILLGYILFEVFHHEFFHHIVESAATSLEIISGAYGNPKPLYIEYFKSNYHKTLGLGPHEHDPLEEALANSYSYNSFSFSSRVNKGYRSLLVKKYQQSMLKGWKYDPPGYRSAEYYINSDYIYGATQLMAMILNSHQLDPMSSSMVAKNVLLNGHTAYCAKPDIPTYLIGSDTSLRTFYNLIPVPNATYTNLFWHEDLSEIDKFIEIKKKEEKERRKKEKK